MMAHDSSRGRPAMSPAVLDQLRQALTSYLGDGADTSFLQKALHDLAEDARQHDVRAEQLLVVLKDVWFSLPQLTRAGPNAELDNALQRVVTLCIREYYG